MNIAELFYIFRSQGFEDLENRLNRAGQGMSQLGSKLTTAGGQIFRFGAALTAGVSTPLIAAGLKSIMLASDLQEVQNVVDVTFGKSAGSVSKWSQGLLKSYGLVELEAMKYVGSMGAMLQSSGLTTKQSEVMSKKLVELTGDMSSFYNLSHEETWEKIRAGIAGETEPLRQLGIDMSVANLEAYALAKGINKSWSEMTQAEKATLRYDYLMEKTAKVQGDFARTSESFANKLKVVQGSLSNLGKSIGNILLPYAEKAIDFIQQLIDKFNGLSPAGQRIMIIVGLIAAAIGPLIGTIGIVVIAIGMAITAFGAIAGAISAIGAPIFIAIGAIMAIGAAIVAFIATNENARNKVIEVFNAIKTTIINAVIYIAANFESIKAKVISVVVTIGEVIRSIISFLAMLGQMIITTIRSWDFSSIINSFNIIKNNLPAIMELFKMLGQAVVIAFGIIVAGFNALLSVVDNFIVIISGLVGVFTSVLGIIVGICNLDFGMIKQSFQNLWTSMMLIAQSVGNIIIGVVSGFVNGMITYFSHFDSRVRTIFNAIKSFFVSVWSAIKSLILANVNAIKSQVSARFNAMRSYISTVFSAIRSIASSTWNAIKSVISSVVSAIVSVVSSRLNSMRSTVSSILSSIRSTFSSIWNSIRSVVSSIVSSIVSAVSSRLSAMRGSVSNVLSGIRNTFVSIFNSIRSSVIGIVSGMVSTVKGLISSISGTISNISGKISGLVSKAKSVKIPGFAGGVENYEGGLAYVHKDELMYLPKGTNVYTKAETRSMLNNVKPSISGAGSSSKNYYFGDVSINADSLKDVKNIQDFINSITKEAKMVYTN